MEAPSRATQARELGLTISESALDGAAAHSDITGTHTPVVGDWIEKVHNAAQDAQTNAAATQAGAVAFGAVHAVHAPTAVHALNALDGATTPSDLAHMNAAGSDNAEQVVLGSTTMESPVP